MTKKKGKTMTRGEMFSPASFAYSPASSISSELPVPGTHSGTSKTSAFGALSLCSSIAEQAVCALLGEVWTTPKPGLVDRDNNGAHTDMTLELFEKSAFALEDSFRNCAEAGAEFGQDIPALASRLRSVGLEAERRMYEATGGINTHKGAIFSMGILCAAAAMEFETLTQLQNSCTRIAEALLADDHASGTHGLAVRQSAGTGGVRKEARSGFDTAFSIGLPAIEEALEAGRSEKAAMVYALLAIIASTEDSNLVHRGGVDGMDFAQKEARLLTADGPANLDLHEVCRLDGEFIKRNLSPGGSADLLAFSGMLYRIKKGNHYD